MRPTVPTRVYERVLNVGSLGFESLDFIKFYLYFVRKEDEVSICDTHRRFRNSFGPEVTPPCDSDKRF